MLLGISVAAHTHDLMGMLFGRTKFAAVSAVPGVAVEWGVRVMRLAPVTPLMPTGVTEIWPAAVVAIDVTN